MDESNVQYDQLIIIKYVTFFKCVKCSVLYEAFGSGQNLIIKMKCITALGSLFSMERCSKGLSFCLYLASGSG